MAVEKLISTQNLGKYLEREIAERLDERQVYDIGNYGWLDADTPDPELVGHAMWQVDPPLEYQFHLGFGETLVSHRPTDAEEVLAVSGSDFEGQMRLARMSLGLSLWQQQLAEEALFDDNNYFWLHYVSTMVMLNAASDRLREFFVMAFFRKKVSAYDKTKGAWNGEENKYNYYQTPFIQARDSEAKDPADQSMGELLGKLASLAENIYRNRKDRNKMIHEVTTVIGKRERELTRQQRQRFDEQQASGSVKQTPEFNDITTGFTETQELHKADIRKATDQIVSWYKTLIEASNHVFRVENRMRRRNSNNRGPTTGGSIE